MFLANGWNEYKILDTGDGEKLELWGEYKLCRPDPQIIWPKGQSGWSEASARYERAPTGGGEWFYSKTLPEKWKLSYGSLHFWVKPTGFKHMGLFPEQAVNWDWMAQRIKAGGRDMNILNLFGYTGGATLACAAAGACVTHVDAAKGMVAWAKENAALSGLETNLVRWIVDDAMAFVSREIRRGKRYDGIVMDPPSYGRGPDGSVWKIEREIWNLVAACASLLSDNPVFMLVNSYTTGLQPLVLQNLLNKALANKSGVALAGEIGLPTENGGIILPCGASGRWLPVG